jgi:hypothetical protein
MKAFVYGEMQDAYAVLADASASGAVEVAMSR